MSDYPRRQIRNIRRQLELLVELNDDVLDAIGEVSNDELGDLDLGPDDVELLRAGGQSNRQRLAGVERADARLLLELSDKIELLGPSKYSDQRHEFHLVRNFGIAKHVGGLAAALEDREAAEEIVRWINTEQNDSAETNKDYRTAFRMFGELVTEGEGKPESIAWVPGGYPSNYDPAPEPEKMYHWDEHILPMLDVCRNSRDRALIALAWDLGPRPGELFDLTVGRFSDDKHGMKVTLYEGKKGTRSTIISPSVPHVRGWLRDHPASDDPDAPLWSKLHSPEPITNNRIRDIFKERADAADMTPPSTPTPTRMRKSSASNLASQGVSQAHLEDHHGWRRGSKVASRYVTVSGEANDREIARAYGAEIEEDDEHPEIAPVTCPRCGQMTPREDERCMICGQVLSAGAVERIEKRTRVARSDLLRIAQDDPSVLDDLDSLEDLVRLIDERPETLQEASDLVEALEG